MKGAKIRVPFSVFIPKMSFKKFNSQIETTSRNPQNFVSILKPKQYFNFNIRNRTDFGIKIRN